MVASNLTKGDCRAERWGITFSELVLAKAVCIIA